MKPSLSASAVLCACVATGCGKKGLPLPPYVRIPAAVEQISARRVGTDVYITVTVPAKNLDASVPVAISRVEIYGYSGRSAPRPAQFAELGSLVARVPVTAPDGSATTSSGAANGGQLLDAAPAGTIVTVREVLTADKLQQGRVAMQASRTPHAAAIAVTTTPLRRFYMAFAFSPRGRPGPPGAAAELLLQPLPDPPSGLGATYTDAALTLEWEPSGGLLGYLVDRAPLPPEEPPAGEFDDATETSLLPGAETVETVPPGPTLYNVYRVLEPDPLAPLSPTPASSWNTPPPAPVNPAPLSTLRLTGPVQFDRRGCYTVRAIRGTLPRTAESAPSNEFCLMPVDVFPPAPPRSLAAVPAGDAISLIWEPNDEPDVAGYLVLRGAAADATLQTLTPAPILEARYRDTTVKPGVTYVYAVVAVDNRLPLPNVSAESNRVEETAR